ncbi:CybS-domain-containing protein [Neurospora tetraspora]|uniref:Succinate dehydrogenase [ubiquinone] cytochrome b small subunit n=1 Tax=Neurospora tetraspora TaxID=94610 RepID=A0AAE0MXE7_9PEZI|nr:CybS-domain-containing protein [Neurospora tetraspora]
MASVARSSALLKQVAAKQSVAATGLRVAAFHTTSRKSLLPPLPQRIEGTVNDPVEVPPTSPSHGSYHWTFDRVVAAGLIPLTVAPFAAGSLNPTMDAILAATILIHSHTGFTNIVVDYVPSKRVPKARKLFTWGLNAATVLVGLALYEFETTDVGLTETIKRVWKA